MVELSSYDPTLYEKEGWDQFKVSEQFARNEREVSEFLRQFHIPLSKTRLIDVQTKVLHHIPKHAAIDLLLETYKKKLWAHFGIFENYYTQRITSSYAAPSLGSSEKQQADIDKLHSLVETDLLDNPSLSAEERTQKMLDAQRLITLLQEGVIAYNAMVDEVFARIYQFIHA